MKVVILAGGLGTRLTEETEIKPKPLVEIGSKPILWHIMKIYSAYGLNDFVICCGYKGYLIKEYFANYFLHMSDVTFDLKKNSMEVHENFVEPWKVTLVDTGEKTSTGGRLKKIYDFIKNEKDFCFTYGDGLSDVNIKQLINFHHKNNKPATLLAALPKARFGALKLGKQNSVESFLEKPDSTEGWINGGFFVLKPEVISRIDDLSMAWEREPLTNLAKEGKLTAYKHYGFWQPMDTIREKIYLNDLWSSGNPPWKVW